MPAQAVPALLSRPAALGLAMLLLWLLQGCSPPVGSVGQPAFLRETQPTELSGPRPPQEVARCFTARASFPPLAEFDHEAGGQANFVYRLRLAGLWFEEIQIQPLPRGGSLAEVRLAPKLDDQWRRQFDAQRLSVLRQCMAH